ncbi:1-phosphofructokinase [Orenia metallireducens]|uniref:Tagatose-6-phosphate kinase n=1 Tax=Orenia metallireducens TaxID=1413210 RepID=A0A1C0AD63_9FIRM|nr:1-phosphofructokinase [Orenia metallireducens]OCL28563.1 1-phosphofructokinase [Orenia metallireducens]
MIITVTLNPAIDKTVELLDFKVGALNRIKSVRKDAGGKGINVSKVIAELDGNTKALGFVGGSNGQFIKDRLTGAGIKHSFTEVEGETRTNLKIIDLATTDETEVNEPGPNISRDDLVNLEENLLNNITKESLVVVAGSLPLGVPEDFYAQLIDKLHGKGVKVVLDTSGLPLMKALEAKPYLIKPNLDELEKLINKSLKETEEIIGAAKELHQKGIEIIIVSLGGDGSIVVSEAGVLKIKPPKIEVASSVGAGDTLVGALSLKLSQGEDLKEAIRYATAASANTVMQAGTQICKKDEVEELLGQVEIEILE